MYSHHLYTQDPDSGHIGRIIEGLSALVTSPLTGFDAAVAYASKFGTDTLLQTLSSSGGTWADSNKRWVICIDFGRTDPDALERLADLPHSEVRIPHGSTVLRSTAFIPASVFHPKAYLVRNGDDDGTSAGVFLGSANLTISGLVLGTECGALHQWCRPLRTSIERRLVKGLSIQRMWFENVWAAAEPLKNVLPAYRKARRKRRVPISDDASAAARLFRGGRRVETRGIEAVRLVKARGLWVEIETLYKNRGPLRAGNQLDLPRGLRVFFGFPAKTVPKNTIFGELTLQCDGYDPVVRTMRFGNNMMDKINLPVPGSDGPASYDHKAVLFEKTGFKALGHLLYVVRVGSRNDVRRWKKTAAGVYEGEMQGGRQYGLLF